MYLARDHCCSRVLRLVAGFVIGCADWVRSHHLSADGGPSLLPAAPVQASLPRRAELPCHSVHMTYLDLAATPTVHQLELGQGVEAASFEQTWAGMSVALGTARGGACVVGPSGTPQSHQLQAPRRRARARVSPVSRCSTLPCCRCRACPYHHHLQATIRQRGRQTSPPAGCLRSA